jgi:hypothetical protein
VVNLYQIAVKGALTSQISQRPFGETTTPGATFSVATARNRHVPCAFATAIVSIAGGKIILI